MKRLYLYLGAAAIWAVATQAAPAGGRDCGCGAATSCDAAPLPPPPPSEVRATLFQVKQVKREVTALIQRRVPRELVTQEKCVEQVPIWNADGKTCHMECQERIIEHRCKVMEVVPEKRRVVVNFVTLVPFTAVETVYPRPCPASCADFAEGCR